MFVMWLGEKITDRGVGNGISLLIMIGIIASFPQSLMQEFVSALGSTGGGLVVFLVEMILLLFVILVTILLVQGTRRIPVQYAKRVVGNKQYGGVRQFIPLKVNAAGVMPLGMPLAGARRSRWSRRWLRTGTIRDAKHSPRGNTPRRMAVSGCASIFFHSCWILWI